MLFPSAVDLDPLTTDGNCSITSSIPVHNSADPYDDKDLSMSTISSAQISNVQPRSITSPIIMVTMPTTNMPLPTSFTEDDTKLLVVWSSIGRPSLCSNGLSYSHACNLILFAV